MNAQAKSRTKTDLKVPKNNVSIATYVIRLANKAAANNTSNRNANETTAILF
ncbi:MAG: hypothetical protein QMC36_04280 [Patescibacteria group bacterium]